MASEIIHLLWTAAGDEKSFWCVQPRSTLGSKWIAATVRASH
jgi:hypothetical protein